jgi:D-xylose transport system permease protein
MQSAVVGTLAVGVTIVLLIGDIDLSIAAVAGVAAAILAVLVTNNGVPAPIALVVALAAGAALGVLQGVIIAFIRIPSFIVTLAGLLAFQGLMLKILGEHGALNMRDPIVRGITTFHLPGWLGWTLALIAIVFVALRLLRQNAQRHRRGLETTEPRILFGKIALFAVILVGAVAILGGFRGVPLVVLILVLVTAALWWTTKSTPFGRYLFAVGGNTESARRVGIPVRGVRVAAFGLVGFMAALAGIIGASRYASVSFNAFAGGPLLLEAIGAAVIGGTSLFGGRGSVWNAIFGALVIASLGNGLDLSGASAADKLMVSGGILLLAVTLDALSRGKTASR